jgi:hypothetical protein
VPVLVRRLISAHGASVDQGTDCVESMSRRVCITRVAGIRDNDYAGCDISGAMIAYTFACAEMRSRSAANPTRLELSEREWMHLECLERLLHRRSQRHESLVDAMQGAQMRGAWGHAF